MYPHDVIPNVKVGSKFKAGDVLAYNSAFFEPDVFNPNQVNWKLGKYVNVILVEGTDVLEDSSAISEKVAADMMSNTTEIHNITGRFDQAIRELVKVGDTVTADDPLCVIEEALTANNSTFSSDTYATLQDIASQVPKAKVSGTVDRIEVFYNGDFEDMSESILEVVKKGDRMRKREAKASPDMQAETGRVNATMRIKGNPVELDTVVIRVYITHKVPAYGGDKFVFANQMKSTIRRVMTGINRTEDGKDIDAIFGKKSIDNRIVLSVYQIGTTVKICELLSDECMAIYNS